MGPGRIARECMADSAERAVIIIAFMGPGRIARECGIAGTGDPCRDSAFMGPGRIARECVAERAAKAEIAGAFMGPGRIARECCSDALGRAIPAPSFHGARTNRPGMSGIASSRSTTQVVLSWGPDESPGNVYPITSLVLSTNKRHPFERCQNSVRDQSDALY